MQLPSDPPASPERSSSQGILQATSGNAHYNGFDNDFPCEVHGQEGWVSPGKHCLNCGILNIPSKGVSVGETELPNSCSEKALKPVLATHRLHRKREHRTRRNQKFLDPEARPEWKTPAYVAYRQRQRRESGDDGKAKWSDEVEEVFQEALRYIKFTGRKKTCDLFGNSKGTNEHISQYIYDRIGVKRDRKQVSSHLQVLKKMLNDNREWMALVTPQSEDEEEESVIDRERSQSPEFIQSLTQFRARSTAHIDSDTLPPPAETLGSNAPPYGSSIHRIEVEMIITPPTHERSQKRSLHTYTKTQSETGAQTRSLEEMPLWRQSYPKLANLHEDGQLESEIIYLESILSLMNDYPRRGSHLSIRIFAEISHAIGFAEWTQSTTFFVNGKLDHTCKMALNALPVQGTTRTGITIPLESKWWASVLYDITTQDKAMLINGNLDLTREKERPQRHLNEITIMQEIWAVSQDSSQPQRMTVLLWSFRRAHSGEAATTTWRKMVPPSSPATIKSPAPLAVQPPLSLDSIVEQAMQTSYYLPNPLFAPPPFLIEDSHSETTTESSSMAAILSHYSSFASSAAPAASPISSQNVHSDFTIATGLDPHFAMDQNHQLHMNAHDPDIDFTGGHIHIEHSSQPPIYDPSFVDPIHDLHQYQEHYYIQSQDSQMPPHESIPSGYDLGRLHSPFASTSFVDEKFQQSTLDEIEFHHQTFRDTGQALNPHGEIGVGEVLGEVGELEEGEINGFH